MLLPYLLAGCILAISIDALLVKYVTGVSNISILTEFKSKGIRCSRAPYFFSTRENRIKKIVILVYYIINIPITREINLFRYFFSLRHSILRKAVNIKDYCLYP